MTTATKPRKRRYGWNGQTPTGIHQKLVFKIGARVRYDPQVTPHTSHILTVGDEGVIVGGTGVPSPGYGSRGTPLWAVAFDKFGSGSHHIYEWALELIP